MSKKSVKLYTENVIENFYEAIRTNTVSNYIFPTVMSSMYVMLSNLVLENGTP